jgi:hypothetical protein
MTPPSSSASGNWSRLGLCLPCGLMPPDGLFPVRLVQVYRVLARRVDKGEGSVTASCLRAVE